VTWTLTRLLGILVGLVLIRLLGFPVGAGLS
jgi:hypothetical protein